MLIQRIMKRDPLVCSPQTTVSVAVLRMIERGCGSILVVEGDRLTAIFTERDLLRRVVGRALDPTSVEVGSVATQNPVVIAPDARAGECTHEIIQRGFRHLPVVDEAGKPVGVVSSRDFLREFVATTEKLVDLFGDDLREMLDRGALKTKPG